MRWRHHDVPSGNLPCSLHSCTTFPTTGPYSKYLYEPKNAQGQEDKGEAMEMAMARDIELGGWG